jgi:hypothetical protein
MISAKRRTVRKQTRRFRGGKYVRAVKVFVMTTKVVIAISLGDATLVIIVPIIA